MTSKLDETGILSPNYDQNGLIAAIAQDAVSGNVLMLAWMNEEALRKTRDTGQAHYWSRSRGELWRKGATSGNVQHVREIRIDCDQDAVLLFVDQQGGACHTGRASCFYRIVGAGADQKLRFVKAESSNLNKILAKFYDYLKRS
ncbi:MAG TPA: phosphoribosyl-AMP cyclohydrolase [Micavibrio sp.]|nr:phosphoribosyl-AMP cyclohydrolase [Micavibrio sp.]